jgi:membrane protease YdiL (CAAX protease family)
MHAPTSTRVLESTISSVSPANRPAAQPFPVLRTLLFIFGIIVGFMLVLIAMLLVSRLILDIVGGAPHPDNSGSVMNGVPEIIAYAGLAFLTVAALRRLSGTTLQTLGLRVPSRRDLAIVALAIVCSEAFDFVYNLALGAGGVHAHTQAGFETFRPHTWIDCITAIASAAIAAPIAEELFFRGLLYNAFRSWFGGALAVIASSTLFGAVHGDAILFGDLMATGIILCLVYRHTRNLYASMLVHGATNLVAITLLIAQH